MVRSYFKLINNFINYIKNGTYISQISIIVRDLDCYNFGGAQLYLTCLIFNKKLTIYLDPGALDTSVKDQRNLNHIIYRNSFNEQITFDKPMFWSFRLLTFFTYSKLFKADLLWFIFPMCFFPSIKCHIMGCHTGIKTLHCSG